MTGYQSKKKAASAKTIDEINWADHEPDGLAHLPQESVVERAWFTIDELNAWADKKLAENPHWVMPAEEPERKEALAQEQEPWPEEPAGHMAGGVQPAQEPVAWHHDNFGTLELSRIQRVGWKPLYTAPPQRPWVEPTGNEWFEWWRVSPVANETEAEIDFADFLIIAQAVITKLKEKNG